MWKIRNELKSRFPGKKVEISFDYGVAAVDGIQVSTWGYPVRFNNEFIIKDIPFLFRQKSFKVPKPEGIFRVIVLGDSLTWGAGLPEEKRYTEILEKLLNSECNKSKKFEVINLSAQGLSTISERDILLKGKDILQPDLIVIGFCLNDPQPRSQDYSPERENFEKKIGRFLRWRKIKLTLISSFIKRSVYRLAEILNVIPTWEEALDRVYDPHSKEWNEFLKALTDIKKISDEMGLPPPIFAVLNQGTKYTKPIHYEKPDKEIGLWLKWYHQAEAAAKNVGFLTVNMEDEIKKEPQDISFVVNKWDGHPSEKLNEIYASKIFSLICNVIENQKFQGSK
jgi:lysophospholipase L1-like esterase